MAQDKRLDRRHVVARLLEGRETTLVVSGLGAPSWDVAAAGDHPRNFYLWAGMGGAAMMGLGLALAQPQLPVLVITGDGEMLMGLGAFATIALQRPGNLSVVVLDNAAYGETGGQPTHTAGACDLAAIARAAGIADASRLATMAEVGALAGLVHRLGDGPRVAVVRIAPEDAAKVLPARDGRFLANRMRGALGLTPL
jgi:thiamine pyrophosphate-dependent acetolactate synthase large subunit-like protein